MIKEWDFVRVFASLSIVLLHSTTQIAKVNGHMDSELYQFLRVLLTGSTAIFILLSIIIIAHIYRDRIPIDFIRKRFFYIILPFIFFAIVYAYYNGVIVGPGNFTERLLSNLQGNFVGWFILPIFQLYLLFWLLKKTKLDKNGIIFILMAIGLFYLVVVNNGQSSGFLIKLNIKVLFPIWLLYFGIAFFIGKYYDSLSNLLEKKYALLIIATSVILSLILIKYNFDNGNQSVHSRRIDLVPYVTSLSFLLLYIGKKIRHLFIIRYLSKYAFGIYLLHWLLQQILAPHFANLGYPFIQITSLFIVSTITSIVIINLMLLVPFNKYMIGNIKPSPSLLNLIINKVKQFINKKASSRI